MTEQRTKTSFQQEVWRTVSTPHSSLLPNYTSVALDRLWSPQVLLHKLRLGFWGVLESLGKDVLRPVQSLDLLGPCRLAILVGGVTLHTRWLKIFLVLLSCLMLIRHVLVCLGRCIKLLHQALLLVLFHLGLLGPLGFFNVMFLHVIIEGL